MTMQFPVALIAIDTLVMTLELYNNHAENDRIFNPRTNHKVNYWKVH